VKGSFYALAYAAVLGTVCALLLTAAAGYTKPRREANAKAERTLNILVVLKVRLPTDASSKQLIEVFEKDVSQEERGDITTYVYSPPPPDVNGAIALQFSGPGMWGPIKGFLALESDMKTIRGITFYEQKETAGLGGEIASPLFRKQFEGKSIVGRDGKGGIIISSTGEPAPNKVDAISGATMTCRKVEDMLNMVIAKFLKEKE